MSGYKMPSNPVELASIRAEESVASDFEMAEADKWLLTELDHGAEQLGFHDKTFFVQAHRAVAAPVSFDAGIPTDYTSFMGITLEGRFATYSKLHVGRLIGVGSVRAVCLAFTDVTLLPYFVQIPESKLLHVPVLAVSEISATN